MADSTAKRKKSSTSITPSLDLQVYCGQESSEAEDEKPKIESTTLWDYPTQSYGKKPKGNNKFQGVTPAFIIYNMLQRYTKPGDLVLDPMAGSGTTVDVCDEELRAVIAYDINPQHPRVQKADARHLPLDDEIIDMVFIDSPYGDNVCYSDDPADIGKISAEDPAFMRNLKKSLKSVTG